MVYVDINAHSTVVFIPTGGWEYVAVGLAFRVRNTTDGTELDIPITSSNRAGFLVSLSLQLPEGFTLGEWEYELTGPNEYCATGILVAYDSEHSCSIEYESENNTIQYGG